MRRLLVVAMLFAAVLPGLSLGAPAPSACALPTLVAGQGPSCPAGNGLWRVPLADGGSVTTHGPDAPPEDHLRGLDVFGPPIPPVCVSDLAGDYYGRVIYAFPTDGEDRSARMIPYLVDSVAYANGKLRLEAQTLGARRDFKVACDANGDPRVDVVPLARGMDTTSFGTIVGELRNMGYASSHAKYWIFYDGPAPCACAGQGTVNADDRPDPDNRSNSGPGYAVVYGVEGSIYGPVAGRTLGVNHAITSWILIHEVAHTMGAVQLSAPNTTGAWHCTDGNDIMCYADNGPRESFYTRRACPAVDVFDCNNDDYFDPRPSPPSAYVASHWNLGAKTNRFLYAP